MKKVIAITLVLVLALTLGSGVALAKNDETGNGCPSGTHYNLNIIGVQNPKTADMDGSNGNVIFVAIDGYSKISLVEGDDYALTPCQTIRYLYGLSANPGDWRK